MVDPPPIPSMPPIEPLVRPRGLPIVISQNLRRVDIPSHLPKFYGTKNEDLSMHMERYMERDCQHKIALTFALLKSGPKGPNKAN